MLTTIRNVLNTKRIPIKETIYGEMSDEILDFPITVGEFFEVTEDADSAKEFKRLNSIYRFAEEKKQNEEYTSVISQIKFVSARLKELKESGVITEEVTEEKYKLRTIKKELSALLTALENSYFFQAVEAFKSERAISLKTLEYKNFIQCSSFDEVAGFIPRIDTIRASMLKDMPLFVRGIGDLAETIDRGDPLGIVGGPCLFGAHEVTIHINHVDGRRVQFDFSTGREYDKDSYLKETDLESYFQASFNSIEQLELSCMKRGVTRQEYLCMRYLFEFAKVTDAKIIIPIPDLSYMKFFKAVIKNVAETVKESAFSAFVSISHQITDMYLDVIDELRQLYPEVECQVLHDRNTSLCELFYERREKYVNQLSRLRRVTDYNGKLDTIIDYITMLALPYYVYGMRNVLQIDSLDEADSMRKCMKIHNPDVTFHSILFPEYLCEDGVHTVFNAPLKYKDYVTAGERNEIY